METEHNDADHLANVHWMMSELVDHLYKDSKFLHDPKAKAIFETSAEVIGGLMKAIEDHQIRSRFSWSERKDFENKSHHQIDTEL